MNNREFKTFEFANEYPLPAGSVAELEKYTGVSGVYTKLWSNPFFDALVPWVLVDSRPAFSFRDSVFCSGLHISNLNHEVAFFSDNNVYVFGESIRVPLPGSELDIPAFPSGLDAWMDANWNWFNTRNDGLGWLHRPWDYGVPAGARVFDSKTGEWMTKLPADNPDDYHWQTDGGAIVEECVAYIYWEDRYTHFAVPCKTK